MTLLFAQQLEDARSTGGHLAVLELWTRSLVDVVATAPTEHLEKDVLVAQPVAGIDPSRTKPERAMRILWMIVALAPAFMLLFLFVAAPHFMDPMFQTPPAFLGDSRHPSAHEIPLGTVILGLSVIWYAIGVAIVGRASRPSRRLVAVLVFIFPATFGFLFGPAVILIMQNLTT
jgi:hypothetical protein